MVFINRCIVYLIFTMVKDRRFQLNTDEVELLVQNLTSDFSKKDIGAAMVNANCHSISSIGDVFEFVNKLIVPFGEKHDYFRMMATDLIFVILSFATSFLYFNNSVFSLTHATIDLESKTTIFLMLTIARFLTYF